MWCPHSRRQVGTAGNKVLYCPGSGGVPPPPLIPLSWPPGHGRQGGGKKESSCHWLPRYFLAFLSLSPALRVLIVWCPFTFPPLQAQRTTCPCTRRPQAPWRHYPVPAPHCCLLKPFSNSPTSPGLPAPGGPQASTDLSLHAPETVIFFFFFPTFSA